MELASPKSVAFPVVAIVTKSITLLNAGAAEPFAVIPRIGEEKVAGSALPCVKSPKSAASPVEAIVI